MTGAVMAASTVLPQKPMIEFRSMHERPLFPFSRSFSGCRKQSDLQINENYSTKTTSVLMRKRQQTNFSLGSNVEVNPRKWKSDNHVMGAGTKFDGHSRKKNSVEGPFAENDESTNNEILQNFCSRGELLDAAKIVDLMTRINQIPDFPCCVKLIRGLINADRTDIAGKVLGLMVMSGGTADVITYNMLIGGLCRKRLINGAIDVLDGMSSSGCPPDIITYNTIIRSMCDHGNYDGAIRFWKDQLRKGCPPYVITYTILVELVCERFGVARASEIIEDMAVEGCYPDLITYNSMINITCKRGNYEDVTSIVRNLLSRGMKPDVVTYNTLLHSLSVCGCWDEIDEILLFMNETSNPPTVVTYNILINGLCRHGLLDRGIDFFEEMILSECCPDIITYNTLFRGLCNEGMIDEAIQILFCMGNNASCAPTLITYNIVIDGLSKRGCMERVMEVYKHMVECGHRPDDVTYRCIIWGFCRADLVEEAVELLNAIGSNSRRRIRENCYRFMIHRLCQKRRVGSAARVVQMLVSSRSRYDPLLCSYVVQGVHAAGMVDEAMELRQMLIENNLLKNWA